jgi:hypothetical protein
LSDSAVFDFHLALGQFLNYRLVLEAIEPERTLYLAVPIYLLPKEDPRLCRRDEFWAGYNKP